MNSTIGNARDVLQNAGYSVGTLSTTNGDVTTFEDDTVLGFVLSYPDADMLLAGWKDDCARVLSAANLPLRRAGAKAWNTYFVILADAYPDYAKTVAIGEIENDLVGTRKIAHAGVKDFEQLEMAMLPLLPIKSTPELDPIDIVAEIRLRTTQLRPEWIETFLSNASETTVLQMLVVGS